MNPVAQSIWGAIENPIEIKEVIELLCNEYEIDKKTCGEATLNFLARVNHAGLLNIEGFNI